MFSCKIILANFFFFKKNKLKKQIFYITYFLFFPFNEENKRFSVFKFEEGVYYYCPGSVCPVIRFYSVSSLLISIRWLGFGAICFTSFGSVVVETLLLT